MDLALLTVPFLGTICATISNKVSVHVTRPFIDEIFHLRQCQTYCRHDFLNWDDKITTPPGLYILGTVYSHILHAFGVRDSCGPTALRSLNLVAGAVALPLVLSLVKSANFWKINVVSLPILFTYYFLFYTDAWSTVLVVACTLMVIRHRNLQGAIVANLLGFASLWFRQTNIAWIAFTGLLMVDIRRKKHPRFWKDAFSFIAQALRDWYLLIPFALNGLVFAAFVKINGGITFGDKENHQMSLHVVQIFYCLTFMTFITAPVWVGKATLRSYTKFAISGNKYMNAVATFLAYVIIRYVIQNYTVVHPFLLADNRHYTFYIYRKILSRPYAEFLLVPVYHFSVWLVAYLLIMTSTKSTLSFSPLLLLGFFVSMAITLVPSPLFEPRYYIVPLVLFRIFICPAPGLTRNQRHMCEFLWYTLINMVFFIVFFSYEFTWVSEPGVQRIIW
ncbi:alpha-1,2-glucosyltransferase [Metschnikowia aff. pulcherrima]|uniref:Dol-P-Glc:Glc(2)Man(9)GlcNAc(2)-PP-Dol alpha-1,2-glucosyltransferase n=1 Tax=Metschnikowia aff. pulcherrima TaxID=2163413 RepID=A0A4P6XGT6_9ASCO|nr:alpha-1,2-glucosyltransferase [Metschnikowia aff. pulcherrima]